MCRTYTSKDVSWQDDWTSELKKTLENSNYQPVTFASSHMKDGRGNVCPATIILPTLAMEAKKKAEKEQRPEYIVDYFMDILEKAISDCKDELLERFNWICAQPAASAKFMYENNTFFGYKPEEGVRSALRHGSLAIGQLGLAECLQILVGCNHTKEKGMKVAKQIEQLFKDKCAEYKNTKYLLEVTAADVAKNMIRDIENKEHRIVSDEEKEEILSYCSRKLLEKKGLHQ